MSQTAPDSMNGPITSAAPLRDVSDPAGPIRTDGREPWERMQGESDKAFHAFMAYRDMTPGKRSVRDLSAILYDGRRTMRGQVGRWSSRWRWVDRVAAWDAHMQALADAQRENDTQDLAAIRGKIGRRAFELVAGRLEQLSAHDLSTRDVVALGELASRLSGASVGEQQGMSADLESLLLRIQNGE